MKHKLLPDLPTTKKLDEILSEGKQRAIAIGSFLAELHLAGHSGGIVFDDPVSSLDRHWRQNVARRLVEEAKKRQVIILTHDTTFLGELRDAIEQQGVDHLIHHLEWKNGYPGNVQQGLPWEHKSYKERFDMLEKAKKSLEKDWPVYPNEEDRNKMRNQYDFLRATIERAIQLATLDQMKKLDIKTLEKASAGQPVAKFIHLGEWFDSPLTSFRACSPFFGATGLSRSRALSFSKGCANYPQQATNDNEERAEGH